MNGVMMDEHEMTSGVIPLRHASLPGHVKLPRRYEKAAMGSSGIPVRLRKISFQPGQHVLGESLSDRLHDLMAAILWVKQELIMLRQHDILLKRQFFDIQHSIHSLQKPRPPPPPSPPSFTTNTTITATTSTHDLSVTTINSLTPNSAAAVTAIPDNTTNNHSKHLVFGDHLTNDGLKGRVKNVDYVSEGEENYVLGTFVVRPASSVTLLKKDSDGEDSDSDMFCEDFFSFRPRTSSMRTSRDMAALARRRGSKELI